MEDKIIIINARIFDGENFIKTGRVRIVGGIIREVTGNNTGLPAGYRVIDINNRILSPGFIDIHTHGAGGIDSMEVSSLKRAQNMSKAYALTGVTSFLLACFFENNNNSSLAVSYFGKIKPAGARFLGHYLEGPFINPVKRGMIPGRFMLNPGLDMKKTMAHVLKRYGSLKVMTLAPELKDFGEAVGLIRKKQIIPAFGHSAAGYDETKRALKSGIRHVTHLFNAMEGFHHRNPGPFPAIAEDPKVTAEIIADGAHVHPSVVKAAVRLLGHERVILITDSTAMLGHKDGKYYLGSTGAFTVKSGAAYLKDNTLIGSCTTLLQMAINVKKWCMLKNEEVLRMVTYNPAKLLGFPRVGRITAGFFADLNVLDDNLKLYQVFTGGRRVLQA
jgi:N-acetylglucosamine-6-phosphate deacetylase